MQDCKAQQYTLLFNAEQLVTSVEGEEGENVNFDLGKTVTEDPWVAAVEVGQRSVKVEHAEGATMRVDLEKKS